MLILFKSPLSYIQGLIDLILEFQGLGMNNSARNAQYKVLPFLAMLSLTLSLLVHFFRRKYIWLNDIEVANLIIPFWYLLNDLIAEVYGYKVSMNLFWLKTLCEMVFLGIYYCVMFFPSTSISEGSFQYVLGGMWDEIIINPFALWIAWLINARLLIRWKILFKGRYFWLRSIGSFIVAELVYSLILFPKLVFYFNAKYAFGLIFWGLIYNLSFIMLFAFPCSLIAIFLKIIEQNYQQNPNYFNPFRKEKSIEASE